MINVADTKRFLAGNFKKSVISGEFYVGELKYKLNVDQQRHHKGIDTVPCYRSDLTSLFDDKQQLVNELLDKYLENGVTGIKYGNEVIISKNDSNLKLQFYNLNHVFPQLIKRLEMAKKNNILSVLLNENLTTLKLDISSSPFESGLSYNEALENTVEYKATSNPEMLDSELEFILKMIDAFTEGKTSYGMYLLPIRLGNMQEIIFENNKRLLITNKIIFDFVKKHLNEIYNNDAVQLKLTI